MQRSRGWGIPVPGDPSQVIYVWFDALTNYVSALDYAAHGPLYQRYWAESPERLHVIGKGILRFHAAYWPAMLLSAGLPLPTRMLVHGYLMTHGRKISKSLGGGADPHDLGRTFGSDVLRYYLLSQFNPANDGDFTIEQLRVVRDNDLADQLGNLVSRVLSMILRYCEGRIPAPVGSNDGANPVLKSIQGLLRDVDAAIGRFDVDEAVRRVWVVVREANRYVVKQEPWNLAKRGDTRAKEELSVTLYNLAEAIRIIAAFAAPFIPSKAAAIASGFAIDGDWSRITEETTQWGGTKVGAVVSGLSVLFPKDA